MRDVDDRDRLGDDLPEPGLEVEVEGEENEPFLSLFDVDAGVGVGKGPKIFSRAA